jgi:hypothetical protein
MQAFSSYGRIFIQPGQKHQDWAYLTGNVFIFATCIHEHPLSAGTTSGNIVPYNPEEYGYFEPVFKAGDPARGSRTIGSRNPALHQEVA